ncbi:uncharacterized protein [Nicotiana tomentosiformis]|uniref:uncharacterized protein n=1 Tax=Nicotiana tomentosiformis TaxID=4098 RepID=UPI00388C5478
MAGMIKLNTYESFIRENRNAGIEGVVRDSDGEFLMAFSFPVHYSSNNQAEAMAANFGTKWCTQHGLSTIHIELDSMVIANMLLNRGTNNLKLNNIIMDTTHALRDVTVQISHCLREANQVAEFLGKLASSSGTDTFYHFLQQMPREAKGLFQLNRWQLPSMGRRYDKCIFFVS